MRNANKSPKIPYSIMVREMEKWSGIRIRDRISTRSSLLEGHILLMPTNFGRPPVPQLWVILLTEWQNDWLITLLCQPWRIHNRVVLHEQATIKLLGWNTVTTQQLQLGAYTLFFPDHQQNGLTVQVSGNPVLHSTGTQSVTQHSMQ